MRSTVPPPHYSLPQVSEHQPAQVSDQRGRFIHSMPSRYLLSGNTCCTPEDMFLRLRQRVAVRPKSAVLCTCSLPVVRHSLARIAAA